MGARNAGVDDETSHLMPQILFHLHYHQPSESATSTQGLLLSLILVNSRRWDSSVSTVMGYGLDGQGLNPGRARNSSLLHSVQTGLGALPASYLMGTGCPFSGGDAARA